MNRSIWKGLFAGLILLFLCTLIFVDVGAADEKDPQLMEEEGLEADVNAPAKASTHNNVSPLVYRSGGFLLIPDSTADMVGMYDPFDGTYLGDLIDGTGLFSTPINAILGPDGNIYVSDQVADSVFVFDIAGNYLSTYADSTDGLNNIRGIDFRDDHLFVTSGDDYVAEFDGPHSRLPDFINDGSDSFDILFLPDGTSLLADIQGTTDNIRLYNADGTLNKEIFKVSFPEQVQVDADLPGAFLNAAFSADQITDFDLDSTIVNTWFFNSGRGIYRLGNGNLLATAGDGVWEMDPLTGALIQQENTGSARFIELIAPKSFFSDVDQISEATGGHVAFTLDAGTGNAWRSYIIVGSVSGTSPGITLPGGMATLPLKWDVFTSVVIDLLNTMPFQSFLGQLDANGKAGAIFDTLGPIPGLAGVTMSFAFALNKPWDFASNPVNIDIVP